MSVRNMFSVALCYLHVYGGSIFRYPNSIKQQHLPRLKSDEVVDRLRGDTGGGMDIENILVL